MTRFRHIVLNPSEPLRDHAALMQAIAPSLNGAKGGLSALMDEGGLWSGWFGLQLEEGASDADYMKLARRIEAVPSIGAVMLQDREGHVTPARPLPLPGPLCPCRNRNPNYKITPNRRNPNARCS